MTDALRLACEYIHKIDPVGCPYNILETRCEKPASESCVDCWVSYFQAKAKEESK